MTATRIDELRAKFEDNPRRYFAPLANEYRKAGDLTSAIELCREFLPNQPGHMSGHIVYGQALFESGDLDEARTVFETALELDPENLIALRHLGDIARIRQDLSVAKRWYERVLEADPRNDDIAAQLAALAAQRRTPISVAAIVEAPAPVEPPALAPAPLLDDELLADVASMQTVDAVVEESFVESVADGATNVVDPAAPDASTADAIEPEFVVDAGSAEAEAWGAPVAAAPEPSLVTPAAPVDALAAFASPDDLDGIDDIDDLAMTAESERDVETVEQAAGAEHSEATVASATALTEALDAFATWDVRDSVSPTAADRDALTSAWAEVESDDAALAAAWSAAAEPASADAVAESDADATTFEAGFFVPEWPNDLAAVGPKAAPIVDMSESEEAAVEPAPEPEPQPESETAVAPRAMTDPWVSIVAASEAAPDFAPIVAAATPSVSTVEAATAAASAEPSPPRIVGLETIDDAMSITGDEALAAASATPIDVVAEEDQRVVALATLEHDEPIITETVAELYLQQGLNDRALSVYRALGVRRPDDRALQERIAMLEAELAPRRVRTAREWIAALATRQVSRRSITDPQGRGAVRAPTPATGLGAIFESAPSTGDERAAQRWSDAYGTQAVVEGSTDLFDGLPTDAGRVMTPAVASPRVTPVATATVNGGFSFDQFFNAPDAPAPAADRDGRDGAAAAPPAEDLAQFAAWLRGLAG